MHVLFVSTCFVDTAGGIIIINEIEPSKNAFNVLLLNTGQHAANAVKFCCQVVRDN